MPPMLQSAQNDQLNWLNRTLAEALGAGAVSGPLVSGRDVRGLPPDALDRIWRKLQEKYPKHVDPQTGSSSYRMARGIDAAGQPSVISAGAGAGPGPTRAVRDALAEIQFEDAMPANKADQGRALLRQIAADLDAIDLAVPGDATDAALQDVFRDLIGDTLLSDDRRTRNGQLGQHNGALYFLFRLIQSQINERNGYGVEDEAALVRIEIAIELLEVLRLQVLNDELPLSESFAVVEAISDHIMEHARRVQQGFSDRGISDIELKAEGVYGLLTDAVISPLRWLELGRIGRTPQLQAVKVSVGELARRFAAAPDGAAIRDAFGLDEDDELPSEWERTGRLLAALNAELNGSGPGPRPQSQGGGPPPPPPPGGQAPGGPGKAGSTRGGGGLAAPASPTSSPASARADPSKAAPAAKAPAPAAPTRPGAPRPLAAIEQTHLEAAGPETVDRRR